MRFASNFVDNFMEADEDGAEACIFLIGATDVSTFVRVVSSDDTAIGKSTD